MSKSNYLLTVDLVVRLINCPGVWLCPNGLVSLSFKMFGSRFRTAAVTPIFPLIFNTAFNFTKIFKNIDSESKVHEALARETVCCELLQWPNGYKKDQGRILATYVGILEDLLFPPEVCISSQIDLLMKPACWFPGILAPKIEIVNKATIKKIDDKTSSRGKSEDQQIISDRQNDSDQQIINSRRINAKPTTSYDRRSSEKPTFDNAQLMYNDRRHKKDSSSDDQYIISPPSQDRDNPKNICTCNKRDQSPRRQRPVCHSPRNKLRVSGQPPLNDVGGNGQSMSYDRRDSRKSISNDGENVDGGISNGMVEDIGLPILSETRITDSRRHSGLPNSNGKQETSQPISNRRRDSDLSASNDRRKSSQPIPNEQGSISQSISNNRKNSQQPISQEKIDNFQQSPSSKRETGLPALNNRIENGWPNSDNRRQKNQPVSNGIDQYNGRRDSGLPIFGDKTDQTNSRQPLSTAVDTNKCALRKYQKPVCHSPRNTLSSSRPSSVSPTKRNKQHSSKSRHDKKFVLVCSVRCSDSDDSEDSDRGAREPRSRNSSKELSDTTSSPSLEWFQCEVCSEYNTTFENIPEAISKRKYKTVDVHLGGDLELMCTIKSATEMHKRLNKILSKYGSGKRYH